MAADSDGAWCSPSDNTVTTVVTCEGDYYDPEFITKFQKTLGHLENILCDNQYRNQTNVKNSPCRTLCCLHTNDCDCCARCCDRRNSSTERIRVAKLEPWNSVRVTLSVPREAAARLRQLASEGSTQLRQLGILSVQVEGDQVISLRLASRFGNETDETTEIVLNATATTSSNETSEPSTSSNNPLTRFLSGPGASSTSAPGVGDTTSGKRSTNEFRSPNVVCPSDTQVPIKAGGAGSINSTGSTRTEQRPPFPFASMQQAAIAIQNRSQQALPNSQVNGASPTASFPQPPPPPYPINKIPNPPSGQQQQQNIAISSPLLVNLLQNEGAAGGVQTQKLKTIKTMPSTMSNVSSLTNTATSPITSKPNETRVPPLPHVGQHLSGTYGSSPQPKVVQNVQSIPVVTTTSSTVPSHNLKRNNNKLYMHLAAATTTTTTTSQTNPVTSPTQSNPRLQQTQQLRNLQQQLIQQQQQTRLLKSPQSLQQRLGAPNAPRVQQPPPYPANRPITTPLATTAPSVSPAPNQQPDFPQRLQARAFNSYPATNVPDNLIPFGQPMTSNLQPIAQPMPHLGHTNHLIDSSLSNITPSLTDLSKTDLDSLLPSLTDLAGADLINDIASDIGGLVPDEVATAPPEVQPEPLEVPEELTSKGKKRLFLINPLSGLLEPMPSESSESESETDETKSKKEAITDVFSELNDHSNSFYSDDDTCSTTISSSRRGVDGNTDQSDSETTNKSSTSESSSIKSVHRSKSNAPKVRRDSPNLMKITGTKTKDNQPEKIKLRLKLEKNEPINAAYKVDVSFVNRQEPKRASSTTPTLPPGGSSPLVKTNFSFTTAFNTLTTTSTTSTLATSLGFGVSSSHGTSEEPRVPPLHISLRGRNSVVISNKNSKKHQKSNDDSVMGPGGDGIEDKLLKKLKIRVNKDVKIKNRVVHKTNHVNHESKSDADVQSNVVNSPTIDNESATNTMSYHHNDASKEPPTLKAIDTKKLTPSSICMKSTELLQQLTTYNQTLHRDKIIAESYAMKNHKKLRTVDLLNNKVSVKAPKDKIKKDKSNVGEYDNGSHVSDEHVKKNAEFPLDSLKRPHSSSPTMNSTQMDASNEPSLTILNGLLHSPDVKKRKLSTSILEMNNTKTIVKSLTPPPPSTPMNSVVGSTNTGTLTTTPTTVLNHTTSTTNTTSASASVLSSKISYTKTAVTTSSKVRRDTKDTNKHVLDDNGSVATMRLGTGDKLPTPRSKSKELNRDKTYSKLVAEKRQSIESSKSKVDVKSEQHQKNKVNMLGLPTAGELDMEAKFKQRLMEDSKPDVDKGKTIKLKMFAETNKSNILNKTSMVVLNRVSDNILQNRLLINDFDYKDKEMTHKSLQELHHLEDSLRLLLQHNESDVEDRIEPETLNTADEDINLAQILADSESIAEECKPNSVNADKTKVVQDVATIPQQTPQQQPPNRSPPLSNSAAQGEDSGIESMDALSEKSPNNQASQSPHSHNEIITNLVETLSGTKESDTKNVAIPSDNSHQMKKSNDLTELGDIEAELAKMEGYGQNGDTTTDCVLVSIKQSTSESSNTIKTDLEMNCVKDPTKDQLILNETKVEIDIKMEPGDKKCESLLKDLNENKEEPLSAPDDCCTIKGDVNHKTEEKFLDKGDVKVEDVKETSDVVKVESPVVGADNDDFDPLPMRRTPPLYTYSNPDKQIARNETDSPLLDLSDLDDATDSDLNSEDLNDILVLDSKISTISSSVKRKRRGQTTRNASFPSTGEINIDGGKQKSLLEQLLIEIPQSNEFTEKASHSPAISEKSLTKTSVRTRASSKLNSPDITQETAANKHNLRTPKHSPSVMLKNTETNVASRANSPATNNSHRASPKITQKFPMTSSTKRKRRESESSTQSTQSVEEATPSQPQHSHTANTRNNKKLRKCSENAVELIKVCMGVDGNAAVPSSTSKTTTNPTKTTKQNKPGKKKTNSVEESSDSDEPLIEIKVRSNSSNSLTTKPVSTRNKSVKSNSSTSVTKTDDVQKPVINTRRSVRNNQAAPVVSGAASGVSSTSVSNSAGQGANTTTTSVGGLKTRSTKAAVVVTSVSTPLVSCTTNATAVISTTTTSESSTESSTPSTNRRKTRSAVTETLQEKRTRRNSKDSK